jgi:tetratricopeptide (TPR) repeat protein
MLIVRDFDQAKELYHSLLQLIPENDVLKIGQIYNELGNYESALAFYQKAIEI